MTPNARTGAAAATVFAVLLLAGIDHWPAGADTLMHRIAGAALPVAVGLLLATGIARTVLAARLGDEGTRRTARAYAEPLALWCLLAAVVDAVAVVLAGGAGIASFCAPVAVGALGVLLGLAEEPAAAAPEPAPEPDPEPATAPREAPAPLWSRGDYGPADRAAGPRP